MLSQLAVSDARLEQDYESPFREIAENMGKFWEENGASLSLVLELIKAKTLLLKGGGIEIKLREAWWYLARGWSGIIAGRLT